jgi:hypothetical protein
MTAHHATAINMMLKVVPEQVAKRMAAAAKNREELKRIQEDEDDTPMSESGN